MTTRSEALQRVLSTLNDRQREAACHTGGPLLIVAGAGTGKTTTLAHRVASLIEQGIDPGRILLLTFTRRAAHEMLRRVELILKSLEDDPGPGSRRNINLSRRVWGGTLSFGGQPIVEAARLSDRPRSGLHDHGS